MEIAVAHATGHTPICCWCGLLLAELAHGHLFLLLLLLLLSQIVQQTFHGSVDGKLFDPTWRNAKLSATNWTFRIVGVAARGHIDDAPPAERVQAGEHARILQCLQADRARVGHVAARSTSSSCSPTSLRGRVGAGSHGPVSLCMPACLLIRK